MKIAKPQLPDNPEILDDFLSEAQECLYDEAALIATKSVDEKLENISFTKLEIKTSIFENCTFTRCNFEKCGFVDVIFKGCDFSNCKFTSAFFERCQFNFCKCMGADFCGAIIKNVSFKECNLRYASFDESKLSDISFDNADLSEASLSSVKLKNFFACESQFIKNNFFKTMLSGINFTQCEFVAPIVSNPPIELKGAIINISQAAELICILGVIVK